VLEKRDAYVQAVCRNLRWYGDGSKVDSIYFGGGTPSLLTPDSVGEILRCAALAFSLEDPEITLEVNPATVTPKTLSGYRAAGVNRLSVGVQDLRPDALQTLGRLHTAAQAVQTVEDAVAAGFHNISCDLMIGTKGQTETLLAETLQALIALPIVHVSAYLLKVEEGTPYARQNMQEQIPDDDTAAALYLQTVATLEGAGFAQYEISNFAKAGFESRHNCRYWTCKPYLGIGPAAHSCQEQRFFVPADLDLFLQCAHQQVEIEDPSPCTMEERIMLGLRLTAGIPVAWLSAAQQKVAARFCQGGLLQQDGERLRFTKRGFLVSNAVLAELLA
jgi:oxygen-independent coproporphyrinogen-3 oxidase